MKLTTQLPLASTSLCTPLRYVNEFDTDWVRLPGIRVGSKHYHEFDNFNGEIIRGTITGRMTHLEPNIESVPRTVYHGHPDDIPIFEMATGSKDSFLEAMMGPVFLGRVKFAGRDGFRIDPDTEEMFLCVNGLEYNISSVQGTSIDAGDNPESSDSSVR